MYYAGPLFTCDYLSIITTKTHVLGVSIVIMASDSLGLEGTFQFRVSKIRSELGVMFVGTYPLDFEAAADLSDILTSQLIIHSKKF